MNSVAQRVLKVWISLGPWTAIRVAATPDLALWRLLRLAFPDIVRLHDMPPHHHDE
jgi:hypothetical protein